MTRVAADAASLLRTAVIWAPIMLASCDNGPRTYNDCLLQGLQKSQTNAVAGLIIDTCRNKFRTTIPNELRKIDAENHGPTPQKNWQEYEFQLTNDGTSHIVLGFNVVFEFQNYIGSPTERRRWTFQRVIQPGEKSVVKGGWTEEAPALWVWSIDKVEGVKIR